MVESSEKYINKALKILEDVQLIDNMFLELDSRCTTDDIEEGILGIKYLIDFYNEYKCIDQKKGV